MNKMILGLDIGIGSVGWALIEEGKRIIGLGVRTFDVSEDPVTKATLNQVRADARRQRHQIKHKASRLKGLLNLLLKLELINDKNIILQNPLHKDIWELRAKALTEKITSDELALIIYHICNHRGFYWVSSCSTNNEDGLIKKALSSNEQIMLDKGYKTIGQMIFNEFPNHYRNKDGDYTKCISRVELDKELNTIFTCQKSLGNNDVTEELMTGVLGVGDRKSGFLWQQRPSIQGEQILKQVGRCRFEANEYRAPKANYFAMRHVWLTKLSRLKVVDADYKERSLTHYEFMSLKDIIFEIKNDITFKALENKLIKSYIWSKDQFHLKSAEFTSNLTKSVKFHAMDAWINIRKAFEKADLKDSWNYLLQDIKQGNVDKYNKIVFILTVFKDDAEIIERLGKLDLTQEEIVALSTLRFTKFASFSEKALAKFIPFMEEGLAYETASAKAGYNYSLISQEPIIKHKYLPSIYLENNGKIVKNSKILDLPDNPIVLKALNQTRKVINAVIKKYDSPDEIHIELARELSKTAEQRLEEDHKLNLLYKKNCKLKDEFVSKYGLHNFNVSNFEKFKLFKEQNGISTYTGAIIDEERLLEDFYVQVDHIIPYSKSFDNSFNNKAIVLSKENKDKGNRTALEYIYQENINIESYKQRVLGNSNFSRLKISNLMLANFEREAATNFKARHLRDTAYICSFAKNFIESYLLLNANKSNSRCLVVPSNLTSLLRQHWGIKKNRLKNDRHHATDAAVIAGCSFSILNAIERISKKSDIGTLEDFSKDPQFTDEVISLSNVLKLPWKHFSNEVDFRVNEDNRQILIDRLSQLGTYDFNDLKRVKTLNVSRAPKRLKQGKAHGDTIYKIKSLENEEVVVRVPLKKLNLKKLECMVDKQRNINLYNVLKQRLIEFNDDGEKAFATPIYMPCKDPKNAPLIRKVSILQIKSGILVRGGIVSNGDIHRIDFFKKNDKYYAIPVYVNQKELPNKIAVKGKRQKDWLTLDNSYEFCLSVYKNDFLEVDTKDGLFRGYYAEFDRHRCSILLKSHDRDEKLEKRIAYMQVKSITKLHVDVLGNLYQADFMERQAI